MCDHCQEHAPEVFEKEEKEGLTKLVDLANTLDAKGLTAEANLVDSLIVEAKKKKDEKKKKKEEKEKEDKKDDKKKGKKPFWLQKKKAELIQLADTLDSKGLKAEADVIDSIIKEDMSVEAPATAVEAPVTAPAVAPVS